MEITGELNLMKLNRLLTRCSSAELEKSTQMFGILADPSGANNALAQVLYGLALR
jgi:hypothetical protein